MKKDKIWFLAQELAVAIFAICLVAVCSPSCKKENIVPQKKEAAPKVMGSGATSHALVN